MPARYNTAMLFSRRLPLGNLAELCRTLRHYLGAALLEAGRAKEAEAVYREDLRRNRENGWALFGLWKSLTAQKKGKAAKTGPITNKTPPPAPKPVKAADPCGCKGDFNCILACTAKNGQ